MLAMFNNVKAYAVFHSKPHLFQTAEPFQLGVPDASEPVFVRLIQGQQEMFAHRVEQFGGLVVPGSDE